jgi:mRNA degradation ribonuclease J1/J2
MRAAVRAALAARDPAEPWDRDAVAARVRTAVRQFVNQRVQRKPVVLPIILEV